MDMTIVLLVGIDPFLGTCRAALTRYIDGVKGPIIEQLIDHDGTDGIDVLKGCFQEKEVTALIGPSGCGKSTFLRCMNRMNDVIDICRVEGSIKMDDLELNSNKLDVVRLRENVGLPQIKP